MNQITPRGALGLKAPKAKPNPEYLAKVRELPCVICQSFGLPQLSPTEAHHPIMGRYSQRKSPDEASIPLCRGHHTGFIDTTKVAIHAQPARWKQLYGEDHEYIAVTQDQIERQTNGTR